MKNAQVTLFWLSLLAVIVTLASLLPSAGRAEEPKVTASGKSAQPQPVPQPNPWAVEYRLFSYSREISSPALQLRGGNEGTNAEVVYTTIQVLNGIGKEGWVIAKWWDKDLLLFVRYKDPAIGWPGFTVEYTACNETLLDGEVATRLNQFIADQYIGEAQKQDLQRKLFIDRMNEIGNDGWVICDKTLCSFLSYYGAAYLMYRFIR